MTRELLHPLACGHKWGNCGQHRYATIAKARESDNFPTGVDERQIGKRLTNLLLERDFGLFPSGLEVASQLDRVARFWNLGVRPAN